MTLSFQTKWGKEMGELAGMPTYFIAKIWESFTEDILKADVDLKYDEYSNLHLHRFDDYWDALPLLGPKPHSIRHDPKNRWREGMDIHFVINNRTKNRFQFAPVVKCKKVQDIEIHYTEVNYLNQGTGYPIVSIDRLPLTYFAERDFRKIKQLAINDGFNSIDDFFRFFNKDFKGKIIHWTDLKY